MSLPPHREPYLLNKFLAAEFNSEFDLRRPCLGSTNYCDYGFFERLDPTNPFTDSRFPRYKHFDFLYKLPKEAVTKKDVAEAKDLSPRHHERGKWGLTICNRHSPWRTSFPDRFPRLEGNEKMKVSGPPVYKPGLESIPNGRADLSHRRLRWIESSCGGKIFETRARNEKWDRYREGAAPITRTALEIPPAQKRPPFGTFRIPGQKSQPILKFYSDSEKQSNSSRKGSDTPGSLGGVLDISPAC